MVLLQVAGILASKGDNVDTTTIGGATTTFDPSTRRQIFDVGVCRDSDVIGLRATLTILPPIYGNTPSSEVWNLDQASHHGRSKGLPRGRHRRTHYSRQPNSGWIARPRQAGSGVDPFSPNLRSPDVRSSRVTKVAAWLTT
ncbi:hypothetical protein LZ31DRAFT_239758 [Colletotrichum somersetense]|nr:hypothetical protein LZ31DRAFT_239758 [Colletotrichum somersetense]